MITIQILNKFKNAILNVFFAKLNPFGKIPQELLHFSRINAAKH